MKRKILLVFSLFVSLLGYSQTEIYFKYDDAGNQRYRGTDVNGKQTEDKPTEEVAGIASTPTEEDQFWLGIQIYPVPVKDILSITWNEENNAMIENVTLYQHSTMTSLIQQQNYPNLDRQIRIDMSRYYMGTYILNFQLKDGRVMSRNIIKE